MNSIKRFVSDDGILTLLVVSYPDGDVAVGFEGFRWHTHPECIAVDLGVQQEKAVAALLERVFDDRAIIAIASVNGVIQDIWLTDKAEPDEYKPEEETIDFRYWSGAAANRRR